MAMDGVGILDSDFAHDIYHRIMDMYHNGESMETIHNEIIKFEATTCELDHEIFNTVYALAMWEFGELTNEQLHNFKAIVSQGASSQWDEVYPNATIVNLFVCCVF